MAAESFMCEKASYVDARPTKKGASEAATAMDAVPEGCFDCNICLDFAADPVVTFCGHLFCWPCIYKWLQQGKPSGAAQRAEHSCPVCKAALSEDTLVPLYGRGHSGKGDNQGPQIPRRPVSALPLDTEEQHSPAPPLFAARHPPMQHLQDHYYYPYYNATDGGYTTRVVHSVGGGVLGGMALAVMPWVCRNQEPGGVYYSSPYHAANYMGSSSTRLRRQEIEMGRLLQQIWLFLLFCAALCLFLF